MCITAGVGSDHIDLNAAVEKGIQVMEVHTIILLNGPNFNHCFCQVTGSNVVSVAEHVVMSILLLVRNFVPAHEVN